MCMTSSHPVGSYASPSNLPYTAEELPLPSCELASLGAGRGVPTTTSAISAPSSSSLTTADPIVAVISASSSPLVSPILISEITDAASVAALIPQQQQQQQIMTSIKTNSFAAVAASNRKRRAAIGQHQQQRQQQQHQQQVSLPLPLRRRNCKTPKERFAAFVAILMMHLDGGVNNASATTTPTPSPSNSRTIANKNYKLSIQAKALVAECCRRNQMGDTHFTPLQSSLSLRLHGLVGDYHWNRAMHYLHVFLARQYGFILSRDALEEDKQLLHYPSSPSTIAVVKQQPLVGTTTKQA